MRTNITSSIDCDLKVRATEELRKQNRTWSNLIEEAITESLFGEKEDETTREILNN